VSLAVLYQSPDLQLPWSSSAKEDRKFNILVILFLLFCMIAGVWIQSVKLPPPSREELGKVPESLVKIIEKKKPEPPKPVEPEKPKEPEPEPEKEPEKPKEEVPEDKKIQEAREKVKKLGVLQMKDDLAEMRNLSKSFDDLKPMTNKGAESMSLDVRRSVIMGKATGTSGGIQTAAIPNASGVGGGTGRGTTQVDSITLGGTSVDGGGGVGDAAAASAKSSVSGNRSEERIRATLDQNKGALYQHYTKALRMDPTIKGKVTFELVIEPEGFVSSCKILASELNDEALESKLVNRMKLIDFGAEKVETTTTRWSIDFLPF
jgi:protein TonB